MAKSVKIGGLSTNNLEKLKKNDEIDDSFDILVQMQLIEKNTHRQLPAYADKWRNSLQKFIDKLIEIIGDYFSPPNVLSEHAQKERTFAGVLVAQANKLCSSNNIQQNRKTIGCTVLRLRKQFDKHFKTKLRAQSPGITNKILKKHLEKQFYTFLSCLLIYEDPSNTTLTSSAVLSGVFKTWEVLHKLDELNTNTLEEFFLFQKDKVPRNLLEITERKTRLAKQKEGFTKLKDVLKEFLTEPEDSIKSVTVTALKLFCQDEEAVKNAIFKWFNDNECELTVNQFRLCYLSFKKQVHRVAEIQIERNILKGGVEREFQELVHSFNLTTTTLVSDQSSRAHQKELKKKIVASWKEIKKLSKWEPPVTDRSITLSGDVPTTSLHCLQINLKHHENAWEKLLVRLKPSDERPDIVFIQEPYYTKQKSDSSNYIQFPSLPEDYSVIHNMYLAKDFPEQSKGSDYYAAAILVRNDMTHQFQRIMPITAELEPGLGDSYSYQELVAGVRVRLGETSISLYSIYCRPSKSIHFLLKPFRSMETDDMSRTVLCMDANACHQSWSPFKSNDSTKIGRGEDLENFRLCSGLNVAGRKVVNNLSASENEWKNYKYIDVTFHGSSLSINDWEILKCDSSSDHPYICFSIQECSKEKNQLKVENSRGTINPVNEHIKWTRQPQEPRRSERIQNQRKKKK